MIHKPIIADDLTFAGIIKSRSGSFKNEFETEPLAQLNYSEELDIKNNALQEYWERKKLPGNPQKIIPSPKERFYRTTTKRKIINYNRNFYLTLGNEKFKEGYFQPSLLEPEEHSLLFRFLAERINSSAYKLLGHYLNYIIIRGNYSEFTIIFNIHTLNAAIVRKLKDIGEQLKSLEVNVISAFIYFDPTRSEYYLESERPAVNLNFKKLFGPDKIFLKVDNLKYSYHPTSFSQINQSIIPLLLSEAKRLFRCDKSARLFDLFCGYGLFSIYLADNFSEIIGIESEGEAVKSAMVNINYYHGKRKIRFIAKRISSSNLNIILPQRKVIDEFFLLDPPKQGTEQNVIKTIALRKPKQVLHIFCGIERIQVELKEWLKSGYKVKEVVPMDLFPGTLNLETLILLEL